MMVVPPCARDESCRSGPGRGRSHGRVTAPPGPLTRSKRARVTHLRECRAAGGYGSGEHALRSAWPDAARAGQYPGAAARPLEDALAVHLAKWLTEQLQASAIGITEVE